MSTTTLVLLSWIGVDLMICAAFSAIKTVGKSRERDLFLAIRREDWRRTCEVR